MSSGKASTICWAVQTAVGCSVTLKWRIAPAIVGEDDEDEEHPEVSGGHHEEVDGDQVSHMVVEERPPGLRWPGAPLRDEPRDGALGHVEAKLLKLAMDGRAPQGIGCGHSGNQSADFRGYQRAAHDGGRESRVQ